MQHTPLRIAVVSACLLFSSLAFGATYETERFETYLSQSLSSKNIAIAIAKYDYAIDYSEYLSRPVLIEKLEAAYGRATDSRLKFRIFRTLAWVKRDQRSADVRALVAAQGCVRELSVVGPFDNPSMEGHEKVFAPERGDVGPFAGRMEQIDWRVHPTFDRFCSFDFARTVQPTTAATMYIASTVSFAKSTSGKVLLGADGAYQIWVNGKRIANRKDDMGKAVDSDAWRTTFRKGDNQIVVKLSSTQDGGLGLVMRLVDTKGTPLMFKNNATMKRIALDRNTKITPDSFGIVAAAKATAANQKGDDAVWASLGWMMSAWQDAATPWRDVAVVSDANRAALSNDALTQLPRLFETDWKRKELLIDAVSRGDNLAAELSLARRYSRSSSYAQNLDANRKASELAKRYPQSIEAQLELASELASLGYPEKALEALVQFPNDIPLLLDRRGDLLAKLGKYDEQSKVFDVQEKIAFVSSGVVWSRVDELMKEQKLDDALAMIKAYRTVVPRSTYSLEREAGIYRIRKKYDEALAVYATLIEGAPGNPDYYSAKANLLIAMGEIDQAKQALARVLVLRPQDPETKDRLAFLDPKADRFYEPWIIDDVRARADAQASSPYSYDTIIDQTIVDVSATGLSTTFAQRVDRVLTQEGIDVVKSHRVSYQGGDEDVDVIKVIVHKKDGSVSEDFDKWDSGSSRKASTTYNDTGYLTMSANNVEIGDLVEFRYRVSQVANENFRGDYFGDILYLQGSRPIGFQRYAVQYPKSWNLFFRAPKLKHDKIEKVVGEKKVTQFDMESVPEVNTDSNQPGFTEVYDYLLVSNKETYNQIGQWWWELVKEQLIVDDEIRAKVKSLVKGLKTDTSKVAAIHNYVVKNTRYLHVGLGIHGWKPYRTTTCFRNRYGDCKDKAALLKVMLDEAGVPAELVLVRTRRLGDIDSYPASMHIFNHAIAYVPKFDLFLDGTAEFNGTSELTQMDQGARALVIKNGGAARWVKLPIDKADKNTFEHIIEADLSKTPPIIRGTITASGSNAVSFRELLQDPERRDEVLEKQLSSTIPGAKLKKATYKNLTELEKPTIITYEMTADQVIRSDGQRKYVMPAINSKNLLNRYAKSAKRNQDRMIRVPFKNISKVRYKLPSKSTFKRVPKDVELRSPFGEVAVKYTKGTRDLNVTVEYSIDVQRIKVEDYPAFRQFLNDAEAAVNASIEMGADQ